MKHAAHTALALLALSLFAAAATAAPVTTDLFTVNLPDAYAAPVILVLILLAWTLLYRESRPRDPVGVWAGMTVESGDSFNMQFTRRWER